MHLALRFSIVGYAGCSSWNNWGSGEIEGRTTFRIMKSSTRFVWISAKTIPTSFIDYVYDFIAQIKYLIESRITSSSFQYYCFL